MLRIVTCPVCGFEAKGDAGLATHRRRRHPVAQSTLNTTAVEVTIAELEVQGRLDKVDAASVQALRSMAAALDRNPFNSQMWREYREALGGLTARDNDSGSIDDLIDQLSAPVRDSPTA